MTNTEQIAAMAERIEKLEGGLQDIADWAGAYPVEVFPEPDLNKAAKALAAVGISLDAISASVARRILEGIEDTVAALLSSGDQG